MLKHFQTHDSFISQVASPVRLELFVVNLEAFPRIDAVIMSSTLDSHQFLLKSTLNLPHAKAISNLVSQLDLSDFILAN